MNTHKVVELSVDDAKQMLVDFIHNTLVNDPVYLKELIRYEGFSDWFGPVDKMSNEDVSDRVGELNLGEAIAQKHDADMVVVRLDSLTSHVIYDKHDSDCNGHKTVEVATVS